MPDPASRQPTILTGVSALLLAAALLAPPASAAPAPGTRAPAFTLPTRNGTVSLDSLRGKVVLVDFWASWCGPCQHSFPWMSQIYQRFGAKGFRIVAIDLDKSRGPADDFLDQHPAPFTVAFDPDGRTAKAFRVWGMPTSFLIDSTGTILFSHSGFDPKHTADVEAAIQKACGS
ncbi:MAG: TlpA family protein disulfide reductase [Hyphomicrobiales bacterium]